jgi:hypothetical protein
MPITDSLERLDGEVMRRAEVANEAAISAPFSWNRATNGRAAGPLHDPGNDRAIARMILNHLHW